MVNSWFEQCMELNSCQTVLTQLCRLLGRGTKGDKVVRGTFCHCLFLESGLEMSWKASTENTGSLQSMVFLSSSTNTARCLPLHFLFKNYKITYRELEWEALSNGVETVELWCGSFGEEGNEESVISSISE